MAVMKKLTVGGVTYDTVGEASVTQVQTTGTKIATVTIDGTATDLYAPAGSSVDPATANPLMDGTAAVGTATKYAREDHVHPSDTTKQATLVSGTNIKTINNTSLLGSGDISVGGAQVSTTTVTIATSDWSSSTCTKNVTGVTSSNTVLVTYAPASKADYTAADIYCSAQGSGTLTFTCATTPTASVTVNVMIIS